MGFLRHTPPLLVVNVHREKKRAASFKKNGIASGKHHCCRMHFSCLLAPVSPLPSQLCPSSPSPCPSSSAPFPITAREASAASQKRAALHAYERPIVIVKVCPTITVPVLAGGGEIGLGCIAELPVSQWCTVILNKWKWKVLKPKQSCEMTRNEICFYSQPI